MKLAMLGFLWLGWKAPAAYRSTGVGVKKCGSCGSAFAIDHLAVLRCDPSSTVPSQSSGDRRAFCGNCCRKMGVR